MTTKYKKILAEARYSTVELSRATGVPSETIRTWYKRKILQFDRLDFGKDVERVGLGRKYSGYAALAVAIMGKLTAGGMVASDARDVAFRFVLTGNEERSPGYIYEHGETLLLVGKDHPLGASVRIIGAELDGPDSPSWYHLVKEMPSGTTQIEFIRLTELWQSVTQTLGIRAQLEDAWTGDSRG